MTIGEEIIRQNKSDEEYMKEALREAEKAYRIGEIPVGAIVGCKNQVIARGHNLTEQLKDVTAHAEMQAITAAANWLGGKYLNECRLFVTLEPCVMCAGALYWSQISEVVFGAADPKRGCLKHGHFFHPKTQIKKGIMENECSQLLQRFFRELR